MSTLQDVENTITKITKQLLCCELKWSNLILATQSTGHRVAAFALPGSWLEMQNLGAQDKIPKDIKV